MKSNYLFPTAFRKIGWVLLIPSFILGIVYIIMDYEAGFVEGWAFAIWGEELFSKTIFFGFIENDLTDELIGIGLLLGSVFAALSKEPVEDEFIQRLRLESLVWALYWNYGILLFAILFIYGMPFFTVMSINLFSLLLIFLIRFRLKLRAAKKELSHEE